MDCSEASTHLCYILHNPRDQTYNGYTCNPQRRIRQHNSVIKGGARFTSGKGPWTYLAIITCADEAAFTYKRALSLEWHIKYPTNKRPRPRIYNGAAGRLASLELALGNPKFADLTFIVYVQDEYLALVPESVHARPMIKFTFPS
jgi:predicted GIY-YIG superfamily endonuclease